MSIDIEQERADFEAWCETRYLETGRDDKGDYILLETDLSWEAYQAGRAAMQSQDREDAERYRWLRENWFTMGSTYKDDQIQFYINGPRYSNATESDLDAAIDHARRVEENK